MRHAVNGRLTCRPRVICRVMVCDMSTRSNKMNSAVLPKKMNLHNVIHATCGNDMDVTVN
jgi:hypothetical protein